MIESESESLTADNRALENGQTNEMDKSENDSLTGLSNITKKESFPNPSSTTQSLESIQDSEKILIPSGEEIALDSKITTDLKASAEKGNESPLSTNILDPEQSLDQSTLSTIKTTVPGNCENGSPETSSAKSEFNNDNAAIQVTNEDH